MVNVHLCKKKDKNQVHQKKLLFLATTKKKKTHSACFWKNGMTLKHDVVQFQIFFFFINRTKQTKNDSSLQWYMAMGLLTLAYILIYFFHVHDPTFTALTDKTQPTALGRLI